MKMADDEIQKHFADLVESVSENIPDYKHGHLIDFNWNDLDEEEGKNPYFNMENCDDEADKLINADEPAVYVSKYSRHLNLMINYPLSKPYIVHLKTERDYFTYAEILKAVRDGYKHVYEVEPEPTNEAQAAVPLLNRGESDGEFGIWGHDIGDLDFHSISYVGFPNIWEVHCDS